MRISSYADAALTITGSHATQLRFTGVSVIVSLPKMSMTLMDTVYGHVSRIAHRPGSITLALA